MPPPNMHILRSCSMETTRYFPIFSECVISMVPWFRSGGKKRTLQFQQNGDRGTPLKAHLCVNYYSRTPLHKTSQPYPMHTLHLNDYYVAVLLFTRWLPSLAGSGEGGCGQVSGLSPLCSLSALNWTYNFPFTRVVRWLTFLVSYYLIQLSISLTVQ